MSDIPLNEEQEVMLVLMRHAGFSEVVARQAIAQERMLATSLGNALVPPFKKLCEELKSDFEQAIRGVNTALESTSEESERLRRYLERKASDG